MRASCSVVTQVGACGGQKDMDGGTRCREEWAGGGRKQGSELVAMAGRGVRQGEVRCCGARDSVHAQVNSLMTGYKSQSS